MGKDRTRDVVYCDLKLQDKLAVTHKPARSFTHPALLSPRSTTGDDIRSDITMLPVHVMVDNVTLLPHVISASGLDAGQTSFTSDKDVCNILAGVGRGRPDVISTSDVSQESGYVTCDNRDGDHHHHGLTSPRDVISGSSSPRHGYVTEVPPHARGARRHFPGNLSPCDVSLSSPSAVRSSRATNRKCGSPRSRSPSPYSCGNASDLREPGNISSPSHVANRGAGWNYTNLDPEESPLEDNNIQRLESTPSTGSGNQDLTLTRTDIADKDNGDGRKLSESKLNKNSQSLRTTTSISANAVGKERVNESKHPHIPVTDPEEEGAGDDGGKTKAQMRTGASTQPANVAADDKKSVSVPGEEQKSAQPYRNDAFIKVSHCLQDGRQERRVVDLRTVSDLMDVYKTLKRPILIPYARKRGFYDQWARFPREESVNSRSHQRQSGNNMSTKCWALYQAIQNDQTKSSSVPTNPPPGKPVMPNPADVSCKSLASIIDHYNQLTLLQNPATTLHTAKSNHQTHTLKSVAPKYQTSHHSAGSGQHDHGHDKSSGHVFSGGHGENRPINSTPDSGGKRPSAPLRKRTASGKTLSKHHDGKTHETDRENVPNSKSRPAKDCHNNHNRNNRSKSYSEVYTDHENVHRSGTGNPLRPCPASAHLSGSDASIPIVEMFSSSEVTASRDLPGLRDPSASHHDITTFRAQSQSRPGSESCVVVEETQSDFPDKRSTPSPSSVTITVRDVDAHPVQYRDGNPSNYKPFTDRRSGPVLTREHNNSNSNNNDNNNVTRNHYEVNTNVISLALPHDHVDNPGETSLSSFTSSPNHQQTGERRQHHKPHHSPGSAGLVGCTRRSKTRLCFAHLTQKSERLEPPSSTTSRVSTTLSPNHVKQSLLINELACRENGELMQRQAREMPARRSDRTRCGPYRSVAKQPELPTKLCSMYDRLEPTDIHLPVSPELHRPRSAKQQQSVSLANVHFLDLSDLKKMLRKTNTPIPRL